MNKKKNQVFSLQKEEEEKKGGEKTKKKKRKKRVIAVIRVYLSADPSSVHLCWNVGAEDSLRGGGMRTARRCKEKRGRPLLLNRVGSSGRRRPAARGGGSRRCC